MKNIACLLVCFLTLCTSAVYAQTSSYPSGNQTGESNEPVNIQTLRGADMMQPQPTGQTGKDMFDNNFPSQNPGPISRQGLRRSDMLNPSPETQQPYPGPDR